jgi:hypothetical protein
LLRANQIKMRSMANYMFVPAGSQMNLYGFFVVPKWNWTVMVKRPAGRDFDLKIRALGKSGKVRSALFPHNCHHHPLGALAVKLCVEDALPCAQEQPAVRHRNNDLMMHQDGF